MAPSPTDIAPLDTWADLTREVQALFGFQALVFDSEMRPLHPPHAWENELCRRVKSNRDEARLVCGASHKAMTAEAAVTKEPVVEECNGGFLKIVVPLFHQGRLLGTVGGCGLLRKEEPPDVAFVAETFKLEPADVDAALGPVRRVSDDDVARMIRHIRSRLDGILPRP